MLCAWNLSWGQVPGAPDEVSRCSTRGRRRNPLLVRKRLNALSIWLGLFAMLMIHAGPLYSALRLQAADPAHAGHELTHHAPPSAHGHHSTAVESPDWLAALELCGYCELLTLNPPLTLTPWLLLPVPQAQPVQPIPDAPRHPTRHQSPALARAPPAVFHG